MSKIQTVPTVHQDAPGLSVGALHGFRSQESWGRWMQGKIAQIELTSQESRWAALNISLLLPYKNQTIQIILNSKRVGVIQSGVADLNYDISLALLLQPGVNKITFLTDKSNRSSRMPPFAQRDPDDLSVAFRNLSFGPVKVFTDFSSGFIYGAASNSILTSYYAVPGGELTLFSHPGGRRELTYSLLKTQMEQEFEVRLDEKILHIIKSAPGSNIVSGHLTVPMQGELHRLTISTPTDSKDSHALGGGVQSLEHVNGEVPFYIQELSLSSQPSLPRSLDLPIAVIVAALLLLQGFRWLFSRERSSGSGVGHSANGAGEMAVSISPQGTEERSMTSSDDSRS